MGTILIKFISALRYSFAQTHFSHCRSRCNVCQYVRDVYKTACPNLPDAQLPTATGRYGQIRADTGRYGHQMNLLINYFLFLFFFIF